MTEQIEEHALNVDGSGRSATDIFDFVKNTLDECRIGFDGLVSQAYDGASVMSGDKGGLQALVNRHSGRTVPYIRCCCHRLHLVVEDVMKNITELNFGSVSGKFFFSNFQLPYKKIFGKYWNSPACKIFLVKFSEN